MCYFILVMKLSFFCHEATPPEELKAEAVQLCAAEDTSSADAEKVKKGILLKRRFADFVVVVHSFIFVGDTLLQA